MEAPLLRVERLRKAFGTHEVLRGIDMEVRRGEVTCIVGPFGSGKSTLLRCLNHLEKPTGGAVFLQGEPLGLRWKGRRLYEMSFNELARQRQRMGMVFQGFHLFPHKTVLENVIEAPMVVKRIPRARAEAETCLSPGAFGHGAPMAVDLSNRMTLEKIYRTTRPAPAPVEA